MNLKKIQNFPEKKKKIILWFLVMVIGIILLVIWFSVLPRRFEKAKESDYFEKLEKSFNNGQQ